MSKNLMDSLAPVLSVPVTRTQVTAATDGADEALQSLTIGGVPLTFGGITFAGDEQE